MDKICGGNDFLICKFEKADEEIWTSSRIIIKNIKVVVEPKTLQSKGMAFVEFGSVKEATNALESLDGVIIDGRTVKVNFAFLQTVKPGSTGNVKGKNQKDLEFKEIQLAKKARNDEKMKIRQGFNFEPNSALAKGITYVDILGF